MRRTDLCIVMKNWMKWGIGAVVGAAAGYLYWAQIGCSTGSCPITSSPVNSTAYGALLGFLFVNAFTTNEKKTDDNKDKREA